MLNIEGPGAVVQSSSARRASTKTSSAIMTIRVDEHEEGPSVMMRKNERDTEASRDREERN